MARDVRRLSTRLSRPLGKTTVLTASASAIALPATPPGSYAVPFPSWLPDHLGKGRRREKSACSAPARRSRRCSRHPRRERSCCGRGGSGWDEGAVWLTLCGDGTAVECRPAGAPDLGGPPRHRGHCHACCGRPSAGFAGCLGHSAMDRQPEQSALRLAIWGPVRPEVRWSELDRTALGLT